MAQHEQRADEHRNDRRDGRPFDFHAEPEDKQRIEQDIQPHADQNGIHRLAGIPARAHDVAEAVAQIRQHAAGNYDPQIVLGIGNRLVAASESAQNIVQIQHRAGDQYRREQKRQHESIAQNITSPFYIPHSQHDRYASRRTDSDQRTDSRYERRQRESQRQPRNGQRPYALSDENPVHDVVQRHHDHPDDRRNRVFEQQPPHALRAQPGRRSIQLLRHITIV